MTNKNTVSVAALIATKRLEINRLDLPTPGNPGRIEMLDPRTVEIDYEYQRDANTQHATKIGQNFQYAFMKIPNGFRMPDGTILITDGQHTCIGAALAGIEKIMVYVQDIPEGMDISDAVKLQSQQFIAINSNQKPVGKFDMYRNLLLQEDPNTVALDNMCKSVGVKPCAATGTEKKKPGAMSHIHGLTTAWTQIGKSATEKALIFLRKYFPTDPIEARVFLGLTRFFQKYEYGHAKNTPGLMYDEAMIYNAITMNGTFRELNQVREHLDEESSNTSRNTNTNLDIWVAKTIRYLYNKEAAGDTSKMLRAVI